MEKIVIFDAYGTLFKLDTSNKKLALLLGKDQDEFLDLWRAKLLEYSWLTSLGSTWISFNKIVEKALSYACAIFEVDIQEASPVLMDIYENPILYDDAQELLNYEPYTACIMSNGEEGTLMEACRNNKIFSRIDSVFSASEVEKYKVSPLVYRMATAHYNIGPSNMLFVSSNPWDIAGASMFGYQTIWVNRNNQIFDMLVEAPDYIVQSLPEVIKIIA